MTTEKRIENFLRNSENTVKPVILALGRKDIYARLLSRYGNKGVLKTLGIHGNTYKKYVENLLTLFAKSTTDDIKEGLNWYKEANQVAKDIAESSLSDTVFVTDDTVAQVISALSPATKWERNIIDASKLVQAYKDGASPDKVTVATYGQNKDKAWAILQGKTKLNTEGNTGLKTFAFYKNIINPSDTKHVTLDRHAIKALRGDTSAGGETITPKQYRIAEQIYKDVAGLLSYVPCQFQAIIWVTYKREVGR